MNSEDAPGGPEPPGSERVGQPLRLVVGLGDAERERALLPALDASADLIIAERCLTADQLLACLRTAHVDAALVSTDLHRLGTGLLDHLRRAKLPMVLLAAPADRTLWRDFPGAVLPLDADPDTVRQALRATVRGELPVVAPSRAEAEPSVSPMPQETGADGRTIITVASGHGSPGRSTVALSLATALGAVAPTVLVDADLSGPTLTALLDADPTRNLYMLAHAEPESPRDWDRAIQQETQPLGNRSPHGVVLCGVPKPEMGSGVSVRFVERLCSELRRRHRYVVLDAGADLLSPNAAVHRTAVGLADQLLLVGSADLAGLWHLRSALGLLSTLQVDSDRVALVLNRHDRRYHHGRTEIEWALGMVTAAVIPHDHRAAQRALLAQHPLVLERRSRAAAALLDLAERLHGGDVVLPPEATARRRIRWPHWIGGLRRPRLGRTGAA